MDLPEKQFSREIRNSLSKETYSHLCFSRGDGGVQTRPSSGYAHDGYIYQVPHSVNVMV